jgi:tetratricopeptide (TPR) repeat protein
MGDTSKVGLEKARVERDDKKFLAFTLQAIREDAPRGDSRKELTLFLDTLKKYLDAKIKLEKKFREIDENRNLSKIFLSTIPSGTKINNDGSLEFSPQYQQQSLKGNPVKSIDELYVAAKVAKPVYEESISEIVAQFRYVSDEEDIKVSITNLKGINYAQERIDDVNAKRKTGPAISWLYDIVSVCVEVSSVDQILLFIKFLQQHQSIHIVKTDNRFSNPTLNGYWGLHVYIQIGTPQGFKHICELKVHHTAIQNLEKEIGTQKFYECFRSYFSGAKDDLINKRMEDLVFISNQASADGVFLKELLEKNLDEDRIERLAALFTDQLHEYQWALLAYGKILEIRASKFGESHPSVADTYNNMANVLTAQGKLDQAMTLYLRSMEINKRNLGDNHPFIAQSYSNMAILLRKQGKLDGAMDLYDKSLSINKKNLQETDLVFAKTYNDMAIICHKKGRLEKSMKLYKKSQDICKENPEHLLVGDAYMGMALVLQEQGMLHRAISRYEKALKVYESNAGVGLASIVGVYINKANILLKLGKLDEAMAFYEKSLEMGIANLGEEDSSVAIAYHGICEVLGMQGKVKKSLDFFEKSLEIYTKTIGEKHHYVGMLYFDIGKVLQRNEELRGALSMFEKAAKIYEEASNGVHHLGLEKIRYAILVTSLSLRDRANS